MANKISTDIATVVDITARRNDSFYLKTELTQADGTLYTLKDSNQVDYNAKLEVYNANDETVLGFTSLSSGSAAPIYDSIITVSSSDSSLTIDADAAKVTLRTGSYKYKFYIYSGSPDNETNTIMVGKFKVVDV
jgi:hypothetical protein